MHVHPLGAFWKCGQLAASQTGFQFISVLIHIQGHVHTYQFIQTADISSNLQIKQIWVCHGLMRRNVSHSVRYTCCFQNWTHIPFISKFCNESIQLRASSKRRFKFILLVKALFLFASINSYIFDSYSLIIMSLSLVVNSTYFFDLIHSDWLIHTQLFVVAFSISKCFGESSYPLLTSTQNWSEIGMINLGLWPKHYKIIDISVELWAMAQKKQHI